MKSDEVFLGHILDELDFLLTKTSGIDFDAFVSDDVLRRACERSLAIIGEAVKNLSADLRKQHKEIGWTKVAGLRDKLIHGYFDVDLVIVWDVIQKRLVPLNLKFSGEGLAQRLNTEHAEIAENPMRFAQRPPRVSALNVVFS
jgi:uncharacterized protein with HEPN domain